VTMVHPSPVQSRPISELRTICEVCGHTRRWHDRTAARLLLGVEPGIERPCYREVGGVPCRCDGFRDSGDVAVAGARGAPGIRAAQTVALVLLVIVLSLGLLYAYRSQTPAVTIVPMTAAIQDVQAGRVRSVTIVDGAATLALANGSRERTTVAQPDEVFSKAIPDYNAAQPQNAVDLRYNNANDLPQIAGPLLLSLLPVFVIAALLFLVLRAQRHP
jgi:hypothetical protein